MDNDPQPTLTPVVVDEWEVNAVHTALTRATFYELASSWTVASVTVTAGESLVTVDALPGDALFPVLVEESDRAMIVVALEGLTLVRGVGGRGSLPVELINEPDAVERLLSLHLRFGGTL